MANFSKLQATATRLIRKNGRAVTVVRASTNPKDPEKPWRGNQCVDTELPTFAAIVDYQERDIDGERIRRGDRRALIEVPKDSDGNEIDLRFFDRLDDRGERWRMMNIQKIEPANTTVVYDVQLRS